MKRKLFYNGTIITMSNDEVYDSIVIDDGIIVGVGDYQEMDKLAGEEAHRYDLKGSCMLPGFIDAHSHITQFAQTLRYVTLQDCDSISAIIEKLRNYKNDNDIKDNQWIIGFGYDNNNLVENRHPNNLDLDLVSLSNPVMIAHSSGHMGVVNTLALKVLQIDSNKVVEGGKIGHNADGTMNGYFEEKAFMELSSKMPKLTDEEYLKLLKKAENIYFSYGITTCQDGYSKKDEVNILKLASQNNTLKMDIISYIDIKDHANLLVDNQQYINKYINHFKIGGYKLFLDGSPQGRTAWVTEPYLNNSDNDLNYCGYPIYSDEIVKSMILKAANDQVQLIVHANGDAAIDQLIRNHSEPSKYRNVIIHAQLTRIDQLKDIKRLNLMPSYFVAHTYYWGDVHIKNFGFSRANLISPCNSTEKYGIPFTFHMDTPVLPQNVLDEISCSVLRKTINGIQLAKDEMLDVYSALKAVTINGAYQYFEENKKGSLSIGKMADFVILDKNPLNINVEDIKKVNVLVTIKDGEFIYYKSN